MELMEQYCTSTSAEFFFFSCQEGFNCIKVEVQPPEIREKTIFQMKKKKKKIRILNYSNKQLLDNQFFRINKKFFYRKSKQTWF